jgi:CheY-like chemotaxis protein
MMAGQIRVESEPGVGSTFHFTVSFKTSTLPAALSRRLPSATGPAAAAPIARANVLVAEDNIVNQVLAVKLLTKRGHSVTLANNGREALDAMERDTFDVVLMDVQMPQMSGMEATAVIRLREQESGTHQRIVAMTAHAMSGDRERFVAAGMDDYLSKPFDPHQLFALVERGALRTMTAPEGPTALIDANSDALISRG